MRSQSILILALMAGCASPPQADNPQMRPGGPNWVEVDESVRRIKEREAKKPRLVETEREHEQGFGKMSDDDYASVLEAARMDVRRDNPKMTDDDVEHEATQRADKARRDYELTFSRNVRSSYEWKAP